MRPSSTDPNASYRATTPTLIDFFSREREEQQEIADIEPQPDPLAGLSQRGATHHAVSSATSDGNHAAAHDNSIGVIRLFLFQNGYPPDSFLREETVQARLQSGNLSPQTLFAALQIAHDENHPLLVGLGVKKRDFASLKHRLAGIAMSSHGFLSPIRVAAQNANNDPGQLIANILDHIRKLK